MELNTLMVLTLVGMLVAIFAGVHIALALGLTAMIGTYFIFEDMYLASAQVGGAAYELIRHYVFATIPLFVLMGDFVAKCGAAGDLYKVINRALNRIPGRLAVATVTGNAAFAAVTGTSIASAAAFSRIAYPEMMRFRYKREFALGSIAGSACLGMLIPPSVLLIVWGIITEQSIGKLFVAGVIPGIVLSLLYIAYTVGAAKINPELAPNIPDEEEEPLTRGEVVSTVGVIALILIVLGGIWGGAFTATEAAGIGALAAMVLAIIKGLRLDGIIEAVIDAGKTSAPIMILLVTAGMYSRFLALADLQTLIKDALLSLGIGAFGIALMMIVIWLLLGMILDSISIILLTVPIFATFGGLIGMDGFAFAIFGILLIEAGLLTPPFDRTPRDPGYIRAYPPGIRENGGQYTHAATWLGLAFAALGDGDRAYEVFDLINPVRRSATPADIARYRGEPYIMPADVGGAAPFEGRCGWTWYTGAAAWAWRLAVEGVLGLELREGRLRVAPCLPEGWAGYRAIVRGPDGAIEVTVSALGDGSRLTGETFDFPADGTTIRVSVGEPSRKMRDA